MVVTPATDLGVLLMDDDLTRAKGRFQDQFDAQLQKLLNDPKLTDKTLRLVRALEVVAETGQAERDWTEEKNRKAIMERRPSTFDNELSDQSTLQEARMRQVRALIKEKVDRRYREQAEAEARAQEARLCEEEGES